MGAYLSSPILDKDSEDGKSSRLRYGLSSCQGWRRTMEDAHLALTELSGDEAGSLFGVFDGHGGKEVALFVAKHMADELIKSEAYCKGDYEAALRRVFHRMDDMLRTPEYLPEVRAYKDSNRTNSGSNLSTSRMIPPPASGAGSTSTPTEAGGAPEEDKHPKRITEALEMIQKMLEMSGKAGEEGGSGEVMSEGGLQELLEGARSPVPHNDPDEISPRPIVSPTSSGPIPSANQLMLLPQPGQPQDGVVVDDAVVVEDGDDDDDDEDELSDQPINLALPLRAALNGGGRFCSLPDHPIQAGCTSVVALLMGNQLLVANAGDSRAVLCRRGKAIGLSEDHKPLQESEHDRIRRAGGFVTDQGRVNGNLNLSRSIGDLKYKGNTSIPAKDQMITAEPDVTITPICEDDEFLILACDGIWDCKTNQEAVDFIRQRLLARNKKVSEVVEELLDECVSEDPRRTAGIGGDNMTCLVVELNGGPKVGQLAMY